MTMSVLTRLRYLPYRAIRRIGTADISRVFGVEYFELRPTLLPQGFEFVELTTERFRELLTLFPELFNESRLDDLAKKRANCYAIFEKEILAAFSWVSIGDVPAEFNHNGDLQAGLPISMPEDTGFVHNVLVMPEYRGKRLYGAMMSAMELPLRARGVRRLLLTTDATNENSLRAVRRMGFQELGTAWIFRLGRLTFSGYPPSPVFDSVTFGRYTGDRSKKAMKA